MESYNYKRVLNTVSVFTTLFKTYKKSSYAPVIGRLPPTEITNNNIDALNTRVQLLTLHFLICSKKH
jgi:hypothetical protein